MLCISVQAEIILLPAPTFLEGFYLNFHMPGHFFLYEVVYAYPSGPLARLHKNCSVYVCTYLTQVCRALL